MASIIVAINNCGVIGRHNSIPWHSKEDFKHFRLTTKDSSIIMGRKTFESLKKPLNDRENIVISRHAKFYKKENPGVLFVETFQDALDIASRENKFIIGGSSIYELALNHPEVNELIISFINNNSNGDKYFPLINNRNLYWETIQEKSLDIPNDPLYKIIWAKRRR